MLLRLRRETRYGAGIDRFWIDVESGAWLDHVPHECPPGEGDRGHHFEVDKGDNRQSSDLTEVTELGNPERHGHEDDHSDDQPHELNKDRGKVVQIYAETW